MTVNVLAQGIIGSRNIICMCPQSCCTYK